MVSRWRNAFWVHEEEQKKRSGGVSAILPLCCRTLKNKPNFYQMEIMCESLKAWLPSIRTHQFNEAPRNLGVNSTPRCCVAQNSLRCDPWEQLIWYVTWNSKQKQTYYGRFVKCKVESASSPLTCYFLFLQIYNVQKKEKKQKSKNGRWEPQEVGPPCSWTVCGRSTPSWHCAAWLLGTKWAMSRWPRPVSSSLLKVRTWTTLFYPPLASHSWFIAGFFVF